VFPRTLRRSLRYAESFGLTTGASGGCGAEQAFILNSLFDPNYTGTGHQPYGFDQISPLYASYLVHAVKVTLLVSTIGGTAEIALVYKYEPNLGGVALLNQTIDRVTEAPMIGTAMLGPSGVDRARAVQLNLKMHQVFGVTAAQYKDEMTTYGALTTATPTANALLRVSVASYSGSAGISATVQFICDFDCEFFNPVQAAQS